MKTGDSFKKRYWPLVLWSLLLVPVMLGVCLLFQGRAEEEALLRPMLAVTILAVDFLLFLVWKLEAVYWFSGGPDFEAAKAAGSEKRKEYAWQHLKRFLIVTAVLLVWLTFSAFGRWPVLADILVFVIAVSGAAISTVRIRFD